MGDIRGMVPMSPHLSVISVFMESGALWITPNGVAQGCEGQADLAFVFEGDLDLDPIFDDLAVLDHGGRLHDFNRSNVSDGPGCRGDGLSGGVAPRARARPDHLTNDDDAHGAPLAFVIGNGECRPGRPTRAARRRQAGMARRRQKRIRAPVARGPYAVAPPRHE